MPKKLKSKNVEKEINFLRSLAASHKKHVTTAIIDVVRLAQIKRSAKLKELKNRLAFDPLFKKETDQQIKNRRLNIFKDTVGGLSRHRQISAKAFRDETARLRARIKASSGQLNKTREKLAQLNNQQEKVIRLDNIAKALTQLGKNNPFSGKEAGEGHPDIFPENRNLTPYKISENFYSSKAYSITQWDHAIYNCVIFFGSEAFQKSGAGWNIGRGGVEWGAIKNIGHNSILGIQVMHWDPKVLYQTTKGMLKRRPNDPVVVFDLYGAVFFP